MDIELTPSEESLGDEIIDTYADLLKALQKLTPEQLAQPAQVIKSHPVEEKVLAGHPVICLDTVDSLGFRYIRSCKDNRRHGEEVVIFVDGNPYGVDGAIAYEGNFLLDEECTPIYPANYSPDQNWTGPAQKIVDDTIEYLPDGSVAPLLGARLRAFDNTKDPIKEAAHAIHERFMDYSEPLSGASSSFLVNVGTKPDSVVVYTRRQLTDKETKECLDLAGGLPVEFVESGDLQL